MDNTTKNADEAAVISRIINGDTAGFRILYDAHVLHLFRFLKQFRKNDTDVQELVQRAFIKAFEGLALFNHRSRFRTWLFRIALNELHGDNRRSAVLSFTELDHAADRSGGNEEEQLEWNSTLRTLFDRMDDLKKSVFILYEVEGYSHAEIAEMLDVQESTSRTILSRTKQTLRTQLHHITRNS